jgi:putative radical SAM enzyme (TIGR03279 family)
MCRIRNSSGGETVSSYNIISSVDPGSLADAAGVKAGETLVSVNRHEIHDVLDFKYYSEAKRVVLRLMDAGGKTRRVRIKNPDFMPLGLNFEEYLMDSARRCANNCVFCFIDQLPRGLRETLYFKDDDARLSFLQGNYLTLTNLSEREIQRIISLKISPVNISVHTTNPELRVKMLRNKNAGACVDIMRRFAEAGITMNCQIVCCPGLNDGPELRRSLATLSLLYPQVASVSVVPVGITRYREGLYPLEAMTPERAGEVIDIINEFGDEFAERVGPRLFYASDELYLRAGRPIPPTEYYDDYPQYENGVGLIRSLSDEFYSALDMLDEDIPVQFSIATGVSAAPFISSLVAALEEKNPNAHGLVYPIRNDFLGETVDVAGLVSGGDIIAQLKGRELGKRLLIPAVMLRHGGDVFLDDVSLDEISEKLGVPVLPVPNDGGALLDAMLSIDNQGGEANV